MPIESSRSPGVASSPQLGSAPTSQDLRALAEFRSVLRKFLYLSELTAGHVGLTTQRFQALLAIWAHRDQHQRDMSVGELSDHLLIRDHSTAELVARLATSGLISKVADKADKRKTLLELTPEGHRRLVDFAVIHLRQLGEQQQALAGILRDLDNRG